MKKKLIIGLALMSIFPFNVYAYSNYIYAGGDNIGIEISSKGVMVVGFYENLEINNIDESIWKYGNDEEKIKYLILNMNL